VSTSDDDASIIDDQHVEEVIERVETVDVSNNDDDGDVNERVDSENEKSPLSKSRSKSADSVNEFITMMTDTIAKIPKLDFGIGIGMNHFISHSQYVVVVNCQHSPQSVICLLCSYPNLH
jgi:hypothetical protein